MDFTYTSGSIVLDCVIDFDEVDRFSHSSGHYTEQGAAFIESVSHKGQDIMEIISSDVLDDILDQFNKEQGA